MNRTRLLLMLNALLILALLSVAGVHAQSPTPPAQQAPQGVVLGSGFTYQGQLKKGNKPFNGTCDFQFSLYDTASGGNQIGELLAKNAVNVTGGVFAVKLDFGAGAFPGETRWLQVAVKCPGDEGFVIFNSRQELTPTPYALGLRLPLDQTANDANAAVIIRNSGGRAIVGVTTAYATAVEGNGTTGDGVVGTSTSGRGVSGVSANNNGVLGFSTNGDGVGGESQNRDGVHGETSGAGAGVFGHHKKGGSGIHGVSETGIGVLGESTTSEGVRGYARGGAGAVAGFNDGTPGGPGVFGESKNFDGVHGEAHGNGVGVFGRNDAGGRGVVGVATIGTAVEGNSTNGAGLWGTSVNGPGVYAKSINDYAGYFVGKVRVSVLEIAGGADLAEPFDVRGSAAATPPAPGMLVCIDSANPGKLIVCDHAYDQSVAGVISGAGGVQPGMVMRQEGSVASGQHPVALTGRVYVWVDATAQPVRPGDLLTTSATPGYAAKATDHARAQGAVIGKAMGALEKGRGLVLVLVNLQ